MFLLQISDTQFINGSDLQWLDLSKNTVRFSLKGDSGSVFIVESKHVNQFLNHLQALNDNITNVESCWNKIGKV